MTCRHVAETFTEWREGTLSLWGRLRLRFHLLYCPGCPIYVEQMDATIRELRSLEPPPSTGAGAAAADPDAVAAKILAQRAGPR